MNDQQILGKAIQKAVEGGWKPGWMDKRPVVRWGAEYSADWGEGVQVVGYHAKSGASRWFFTLPTLIFNHEFAKALWGEEPIPDVEEEPGTWTKTAWKMHLQQMVIADDPIKYLGDHLE